MADPQILYEDNHVIVALKPENMLSQADNTGDPDMLSVLKDYIKDKYQKPGAVYLGLVHRLDRPVSGLMVFARTSKAASRLVPQLQKHAMGRQYLCVCEGDMPDSFSLTDWLEKDEKRNMVSVCPSSAEGAKKAILHGKVLQRKNGKILCAIRLETGRSHQIRVQMSHAGAPLWGDARYGSGNPGQQIALFGYRLSFEHPTTHLIHRLEKLPVGGIWEELDISKIDFSRLPWEEGENE